MLVLERRVEVRLRRLAKKSGVNLQELLRARVIPDWLYGQPVVSNRTIERLQKKGLIPMKEATKTA